MIESWQVGRDESCGVCIASRRIEPQHAVLTFDAKAGLFSLRDLDTTNGVRGARGFSFEFNDCRHS